MRINVREIFVEGYLKDTGKDLEDLRVEASENLRNWLEGTKYSIPMECPECESRLLYSEDRGRRFCAFCRG